MKKEEWVPVVNIVCDYTGLRYIQKIAAMKQDERFNMRKMNITPDSSGTYQMRYHIPRSQVKLFQSVVKDIEYDHNKVYTYLAWDRKSDFIVIDRAHKNPSIIFSFFNPSEWDVYLMGEDKREHFEETFKDKRTTALNRYHYDIEIIDWFKTLGGRKVISYNLKTKDYEIEW